MAAACTSSSMASSTTAAGASGRSTTSWRRALQSPYLDWYHVDRGRLAAGGALDAYPAPDSPDAGGGDLGRLGYEAWWGLPALPKLNHGQPLVREYVMRVAEHWLRAGADGWRLDVPEEIHEPGFWQEFRRARQGRPGGRLHRRRDLASRGPSCWAAIASTR